MNFVVMMLSLLLMVGGLILFGIAFVRDDHQAGESPETRKRRIFKCCSVGTLLGVLGILLFVFVFMPGIVGARIQEAEEIARSTFREKIGREPDSLKFDGTNRQTGWDGWKYLGVAHVGDEVWDVTVTRSNDQGARTTTLRCEAMPRE